MSKWLFSVSKVNKTIEDPDGKEAKDIVNKVVPFLSIPLKKVPFGTLEYGTHMTDVIAQALRYGGASAFITWKGDPSQYDYGWEKFQKWVSVTDSKSQQEKDHLSTARLQLLFNAYTAMAIDKESNHLHQAYNCRN